MVQTFSEQKVDRIFCLGDVFHERSKMDIDALSEASRFFDNLSLIGAPIHILVGNHDLPRYVPRNQIDASRNPSTIDMLDLAVLREENKFFVHKTMKRTTLDGFKCFIVPWLDDLSDLQSEFKRLDPTLKKETIFMGHLTVNGAALTVRPDGEPQQRCEYFGSMLKECVSPTDLSDFSISFLGHFHSPQMLSSNAMYIGAPMQHNFGDAHSKERGVAIFCPDEWTSGTTEVYSTPLMHMDDVKGFSFIRNPSNDFFRIYRMKDFAFDEYSGKLLTPQGSKFNDLRGKKVRVDSASDEFVKWEQVQEFFLNSGVLNVRNAIKEYPQVSSTLPHEIKEQPGEDRFHTLSMQENLGNFFSSYPPEKLKFASKQSILAVGQSLLDQANQDDFEEDSNLLSASQFNANLESVTIENFLGIQGSQHFDFTLIPKGICFIKGPNGSGKSTIFEAVTWCLFGQCLRSDMTVSDVVNDTSDKEANVKIKFTNGIGIERSRSTTKLAPRLIISAYNKVVQEYNARDYSITQKKLSAFLGTDFSAFVRTVVLGDHDICANFLSARPSERREIIEQLSGISILDTCAQVAKQKIKEKLDKSTELKKSIQDNDEMIENLKFDVKHKGEVSDAICEQIRVETEKQRNLSRRQIELRAALHRSANEGSMGNNSDLISKEIELCKEKRKSLEEKLAFNNLALESQQKKFTEVFKKLSSLNVKKCPVCEQDIEIDKMIALQKSFSAELSQLSDEKESTAGTGKELQELLALLFREESELTEKLNDPSIGKPSHRNLTVSLGELEQCIREFTASTQKMESLQNEYIGQQKRVKSLLAEIDRACDETECFKQQYREISSIDVPILKFWESSFSKTVKDEVDEAEVLTNFRAYCTAGIIKQINIHLNSLMLAIANMEKSPPLPIALSSSLKIRGGFGKRSSGQRQRNLIALLLTLNLVSRSKSRFVPNFLFLDEIFDRLDASGQNAMFSILNELEIDHIWIITHSSNKITERRPTIQVSMSEEGGSLFDLSGIHETIQIASTVSSN